MSFFITMTELISIYNDMPSDKKALVTRYIDELLSKKPEERLGMTALDIALRAIEKVKEGR